MTNVIVLELGYMSLTEFRERTQYQISLATIAEWLEVGSWLVYAINRGDRALTLRHQRELWLVWREIQRQQQEAA